MLVYWVTKLHNMVDLLFGHTEMEISDLLDGDYRSYVVARFTNAAWWFFNAGQSFQTDIVVSYKRIVLESWVNIGVYVGFLLQCQFCSVCRSWVFVLFHRWCTRSFRSLRRGMRRTLYAAWGEWMQKVALEGIILNCQRGTCIKRYTCNFRNIVV